GTNEIIAFTANIKDAIITSAKIASLSANKITGGTITATVGLTAAQITSNSYINVGSGTYNEVYIDSTGIYVGTIEMYGATNQNYIKMGSSYQVSITGGVAAANVSVSGAGSYTLQAPGGGVGGLY